MAQLKTILFSFIRTFPLGEIARFVFSLGAKLFFRLRRLRVGSKNQLKNIREGAFLFLQSDSHQGSHLNGVLPECIVLFLVPLVPFVIPSEAKAATQPM